MSRVRTLPGLLALAVLACLVVEAAVLVADSKGLGWGAMLVAVLLACWQAVAAARRLHGRLRRTWILASAAATSWLVALVVLAVEGIVRPGEHELSIAEPVLLVSTVLAPIVLLSWPLSVNTSHRPSRMAFEVLLSALALVYAAWPFLLGDLVDEGGAQGWLGVVYVGLHVFTITAALAALGGTRRMHRTSLLLAVGGFLMLPWLVAFGGTKLVNRGSGTAADSGSGTAADSGSGTAADSGSGTAVDQPRGGDDEHR